MRVVNSHHSSIRFSFRTSQTEVDESSNKKL